MAKSAKKWALGAAVAAVAGYVAGILTAPKSGKDTRQDIKTGAVKVKTEAEKKLKEAHSELDKLLGQAKVKGDMLSGKAKSEFTDIVSKAKNAKEKVRDLLSSLHDGGAEEPELKQALKDARDALKHLEKFVKSSK